MLGRLFLLSLLFSSFMTGRISHAQSDECSDSFKSQALTLCSSETTAAEKAEMSEGVTADGTLNGAGAQTRDLTGNMAGVAATKAANSAKAFNQCREKCGEQPKFCKELKSAYESLTRTAELANGMAVAAANSSSTASIQTAETNSGGYCLRSCLQTESVANPLMDRTGTALMFKCCSRCGIEISACYGLKNNGF